MSFVVIDVETANPDFSSICQIGIAKFNETGEPVLWNRLIDPQEYFDSVNVSVHGITEESVRNAPILPDVFADLKGMLEGQIVVSHTHFDRTSIQRAFAKYGLTPIECKWLDSARVVRRTWSEFSSRGYGLANVARSLGIVFEHHNAVEDARAAGEVLLRALDISNLSLEEWLSKIDKPITERSVARQGALGGPLSGEVVVFTGALSISRKEAASHAAEAGCDVTNSVNKKTTILVVGNQDITRLGGKDKSSKHIKAEKMIQKGQSLRIIGESDFMALVEQSQG
jgi:DNA polymerase-3 subunit epsilon